MRIGRGLLLSSILLAMPVAAQDVTAPVWATPDHFWFRTTVPGGHEWWHVDARHGIRERLFDHRRLAIEVNQKTGGEYTPLTLPFADTAARFIVKYDGSNSFTQEGALAIEFVAGDEQWRCELQGEWDWGRTPPSDYECQSQGAPEPAAPAAAARAVRSPDGKLEALIQNDNVAVRPVGLASGASAKEGGGAAKTLSTDGTSAFAWQLGSIQWSKDSRTVTAYRLNSAIWRTPPANGSVKEHIQRKQWNVR
jgi:hypothetical protein